MAAILKVIIEMKLERLRLLEYVLYYNIDINITSWGQRTKKDYGLTVMCLYVKLTGVYYAGYFDKR